MAPVGAAVAQLVSVDGRARSGRLALPDGARTTVHVACFDAARTELRVAVLPAPRRLEAWCAGRGVREALVGGFFTRPAGTPLGEVRTHGVVRPYVPFAAPWGAMRSCLHVEGGVPQIVPRDWLPAQPRGDLLQAGPLLVAGGERACVADIDPEGFSAAAHQFDSDITAGRHPRAAIGLAAGRIVAAVCDGRARDDAGLTLPELAELMVALGCDEALNLDGGGSASLVSGGQLRNHPRRGFEDAEPGGRPVATALELVPRRV